jgi:hypothetical protein
MARLNELRPVIRTAESRHNPVDPVAWVGENVANIPLAQPCKQIIGNILSHVVSSAFGP